MAAYQTLNLAGPGSSPGDCTVKICKWHLCGKVLTGRQRSFCGPKCKNKYGAVAARERNKQKAVEYLGGKCQECGYDKCIACLEFHHRDPKAKEYEITNILHSKGWPTIQAELDKCDLLCANCHREVEFSLDMARRENFSDPLTRAAT